MILADIQSDINTVLSLIGGCFGFTLVMVFLAARLLFRSMRREYKEAGGNEQLAKNILTKGPAAILKTVIKRRFR